MDRIRCEGPASLQTFNLKSRILGLRNYLKVYNSVRRLNKDSARCAGSFQKQKTFVVILTFHFLLLQG